MRLKIEWCDIEDAQREHGRSCVVARAIKRSSGHALFVTDEDMWDGGELIAPGQLSGGVRVASTPKEVETYINAFDRGEIVLPTEFDIPGLEPLPGFTPAPVKQLLIAEHASV